MPEISPRVLHLNTAKTWRGGERQVWFLARGLQERGVTQWVVGRPGSELEKRCRTAGLPFHGIAMRGEWDLLAVRRLRQFIRRENLNVLHAHTSRAHGLGLMAVARTPQCRLLVSRRVDFPAGRNWLSRRKYLSPRIARFIAISENVKRVLLADGVPADRIGIAYSGIDLERFAPLSGQALYASIKHQAALAAEFGLSQGKAEGGPPHEAQSKAQPEKRPVVLGNVAALVDHKDQATLLNALALIPGATPSSPPDAEDQAQAAAVSGAVPFRCLIFGEGELRERLETQARELGLLNRLVFFAGFREGIDDAYRLFDIFVMSSKEEGLGTAVLDAMGFGLPVAATAGGGIPEMIDDDQGGFLSPVGDARKLAADLTRLIESPELRERFGEYNRKRVRDFSHQATCEATLRIYAEVLAESESPAPADDTRGAR